MIVASGTSTPTSTTVDKFRRRAGTFPSPRPCRTAIRPCTSPTASRRSRARPPRGPPRAGDESSVSRLRQRADPEARSEASARRQARHDFVEPLDRYRAGVDRLCPCPGRLLPKRGDVHVAEIGEHQRARDRRRSHPRRSAPLALGGEREALPHAEVGAAHGPQGRDRRRRRSPGRSAWVPTARTRCRARPASPGVRRPCHGRSSGRCGGPPSPRAAPCAETWRASTSVGTIIAGADRLDDLRHRDDDSSEPTSPCKSRIIRLLGRAKVGADLVDRPALRRGQREGSAASRRLPSAPSATWARPRLRPHFCPHEEEGELMACSSS